MWMATKVGWFSIVRKEGTYHIRSRARKDLEGLAELVPDLAAQKIHETTDADYRWRICTEKEEVILSVMEALGREIDYGNFKSMIGKTASQKDKVGPYSEIWHVMYSYQMDDPR